MAWTAPKTYSTSEVLTAADMNTFQRDNIDDLHRRITQVLQMDSTTLTDDTVGAVNTWEQWGTEEVTFSDPNQDISLYAFVCGNVEIDTLDDVHEDSGRTRVQISFDGGTNWDTGTANRDHVAVGTSIAVLGGSLYSQHLKTGTPSGQIQIRAQILKQNNTDGDFRDGQIVAIMKPVGD